MSLSTYYLKVFRMVDVHVNLDDDVDDWIRTRTKRKGDLSQIVNNLLRQAIFGDETK